MIEAQQIHLARQGDQVAWEALMRTHQEPVFRLAYLLLGDPDEAEDIAQETFLRAYKALRRFDTERPLRPWLLRIASNLSHNRHRSIGRYLATLMSFVQQDPDSIKPATINLEDNSQALWQAARKMAKPFQEVIYLRYFLDMSENEMANALDVPTGTVKSRLHRALSKLRGIIERDYPELKEIVE
ncbi:MAG: RNA polymerase sigma factor [Anaerolineales bacterium]|nr:RNA polymerase sigma factor [Anaerolineales bacterium]